MLRGPYNSSWDSYDPANEGGGSISFGGGRGYYQHVPVELEPIDYPWAPPPRLANGTPEPGAEEREAEIPVYTMQPQPTTQPTAQGVDLSKLVIPALIILAAIFFSK